jgi:Ca-activated chloride channel family protein
MISFLGRIDRPVMTGVTLDWGGAPPPESYPAPLPDLHAGEPVFVSLRLGPGRVGELVSLRGRLAGGPASFSLSIAPDAPVGSGVATRWARARVESLMDSLHEGAEAADVRREVIAVASRFNLVTRYTSLVAVDHYPTARSEAMLAQGGTRGRLLLLIGALMTAACALVCLILRRGR